MDYIIGIDSDGTIFDSMNLKHKEVFWQCMIDVWDLSGAAPQILQAAQTLNLHSRDRGINRFPGLLKLMRQTEYFRDTDLTDLSDFVASEYPMSNDGLVRYMRENRPHSRLLEQTLCWSRAADRLFAEKSEHLPPFKGAVWAIAQMKQSAHIAIVSSASKAILQRDLEKGGLLGSVELLMGQENGKKTQQLRAAMERFHTTRALMIGDAPGDCEAARQNGARFYPILPEEEEESWALLEKRYFPMFLENAYTESTERELYRKFMNYLGVSE